MKKIMKQKKWLLYSGLFSLVLFLSGCVDTYKTGAQTGQPTGEGWVYQYLVTPMSNAINYFHETFNWNYGWAIIAVTILVRLIIIMPLSFYQSKKSTIQTEKMAILKPQLDIVNKRMKEALTPEEQMKARAEMQRVYKENGVSMFGGMGCFPLVIQMPFFTALYFAARYTPGLSEASFFEIALGKPSIILLVVVAIIYFIQSLISLQGIPEEQKKMMRTTMFMSPLMIVFVSFTAPAGVDLYWIVGGIFSSIQILITNHFLRPRIKRQLAEEIAKMPIKVVVEEIVGEEVVAEVTELLEESEENNQKKSTKRNAGKQQKR